MGEYLFPGVKFNSANIFLSAVVMARQFSKDSGGYVLFLF